MMNKITKWYKAVSLLSLCGLTFAATADVRQGYIITRVKYDGINWQVIEAPRLIPCNKNIDSLRLTTDHSIVEGFSDSNEKLTEFRFPNPRIQISKTGATVADSIVTDIILPADANIASLQFKEDRNAADASLIVDVRGVETPEVTCEPPRSALRPLPTETAAEEV